MKRLRRIQIYAAGLFALAMGMATAGIIGSEVDMSEFSGTRTTPAGEGVFATSRWAPRQDGGPGFEIEWDINYAAPVYDYEYTFRNPGAANDGAVQPELSHFVVQVSDIIPRQGWEDYITLTGSGSGEVDTYGPGQGDSNPGLDGLYGLKVEGRSFTVQFESAQRPVWGHFYAKSGRRTYAMNAGLRYMQSGTSFDQSDRINYVPTVDTVSTSQSEPVPEPQTLALGLIGLAGCALTIRKRRR